MASEVDDGIADNHLNKKQSRNNALNQIVKSVTSVIDISTNNEFKMKCLEIIDADDLDELKRKAKRRLNNLMKKDHRPSMVDVAKQGSQTKENHSGNSSRYSPIRKRSRSEPLISIQSNYCDTKSNVMNVNSCHKQNTQNSTESLVEDLKDLSAVAKVDVSVLCDFIDGVNDRLDQWLDVAEDGSINHEKHAVPSSTDITHSQSTLPISFNDTSENVTNHENAKEMHEYDKATKKTQFHSFNFSECSHSQSLLHTEVFNKEANQELPLILDEQKTKEPYTLDKAANIQLALASSNKQKLAEPKTSIFNLGKNKIKHHSSNKNDIIENELSSNNASFPLAENIIASKNKSMQDKFDSTVPTQTQETLSQMYTEVKVDEILPNKMSNDQIVPVVQDWLKEYEDDCFWYKGDKITETQNNGAENFYLEIQELFDMVDQSQ